ncbi:hypothetical protein [Nocardia sp. NPDC005978]|uniref:hypothetical protein n=1 Tax=unclassified Nocardia TaxID=2637762 RepID=UPI0033ACFD2F
MIIDSRNHPRNTTRIDRTSTAVALALCLFFFLGLTLLTGSALTALTGTAGLLGALVMTFQMLALPTDTH